MVDSLEAGGPEGDTTAHRHKGRAEATSLRVVLGDKVTTHMIPPNGEMALGRGGDIVVPHVNISRRHLAVRSGPRIEVCDLGSTNLSMLHGTALDPNTWIPVRAGDVLVIGGEALVVFHEARCAPTRHMGEESLEREIASHIEGHASSGAAFAVISVQSRSSTRWIDVVSAVLLERDELVMVSDVQVVLVLTNRTEEQAEAITRVLEDHLNRLGAMPRVRLRYCPRDGVKAEDLLEKPAGENRMHRTTMRPAGPLVRNAAMLKLYGLVDEIAPSPANILILGETGTGKDVLAHALHNRSGRASAPFVSLNCASLPETLLESELFGYERGAFTGAVSSKPGLLESAEGGTVFLDELGEMPLATQAKLLRVLEEKTVRRVGALKPRTIDIRLLSATNRDLHREIAERAVLLCRDRIITKEHLPPEFLDGSPVSRVPLEDSGAPPLDPRALRPGAGGMPGCAPQRLTQEPRAPTSSASEGPLDALLTYGTGEFPRANDVPRLLDEMDRLETRGLRPKFLPPN